MSLETPTVMHKYDAADFNTYSYWQLYFQESGTFRVNGTMVSGGAGFTIEIELLSPPIYISGGTGLYLLGGNPCYCSAFNPPYTGSTSNEYPGGTRYYYGDINDDGTRFSTR
jgi:hypothetical protein